jgi:hypothetical protein
MNMLKQRSLTKQNQVVLCAAILAGHSTYSEQGFRQRDVRFLFDLFSNWIGASFERSVSDIQNTQIARFLEDLRNEGFLKKNVQPMKPSYRLTRLGLIDLLNRITNQSTAYQEEFLFLFYFIKNYRNRLITLVEKEGAQFPLSVKLELQSLLDVRSLVSREIARIEKEILKIESRINDADATSQLTKVKQKAGATLGEIINEAERKYPYELNSQKPLGELINSIPIDQRIWELEIGNIRRCEEIWSPTRQILKAYLAELRKLAC